MHVEAGSSVALKCLVNKAMYRPRFVFWYRNKVRLVNSDEDGVTIVDDVKRADRPKSVARTPGNSPESDVISYWRNSDDLVAEGLKFKAAEAVTSYLTIKSATAKDSGTYSCAPDNARPAKINLHVIKG